MLFETLNILGVVVLNTTLQNFTDNVFYHKGGIVSNTYNTPYGYKTFLQCNCTITTDGVYSTNTSKYKILEDSTYINFQGVLYDMFHYKSDDDILSLILSYADDYNKKYNKLPLGYSFSQNLNDTYSLRNFDYYSYEAIKEDYAANSVDDREIEMFSFYSDIDECEDYKLTHPEISKRLCKFITNLKDIGVFEKGVYGTLLTQGDDPLHNIFSTTPDYTMHSTKSDLTRYTPIVGGGMWRTDFYQDSSDYDAWFTIQKTIPKNVTLIDIPTSDYSSSSLWNLGVADNGYYYGYRYNFNGNFRFYPSTTASEYINLPTQDIKNKIISSTINGTEARLYIDGVLQSSITSINMNMPDVDISWGACHHPSHGSGWRVSKGGSKGMFLFDNLSEDEHTQVVELIEDYLNPVEKKTKLNIISNSHGRRNNQVFYSYLLTLYYIKFDVNKYDPVYTARGGFMTRQITDSMLSITDVFDGNEEHIENILVVWELTNDYTQYCEDENVFNGFVKATENMKNVVDKSVKLGYNKIYIVAAAFRDPNVYSSVHIDEVEYNIYLDMLNRNMILLSKQYENVFFIDLPDQFFMFRENLSDLEYNELVKQKYNDNMFYNTDKVHLTLDSTKMVSKHIVKNM